MLYNLINFKTMVTLFNVFLLLIFYIMIWIELKKTDSLIISKSRNLEPSRRPTGMYNLPHLYDVQDYLHGTDLQEVQEL